MKEEDKAIAAKAAEYAMKETERICKRAGLTKSKVLKRIKEGLDAKNDSGADHRIRLKAAEMAIPLVGLEKPKQIEFPDEHGKPQPIGGMFTNMELAARLLHIIQKAKDAKRSAKD